MEETRLWSCNIYLLHEYGGQMCLCSEWVCSLGTHTLGDNPRKEKKASGKGITFQKEEHFLEFPKHPA